MANSSPEYLALHFTESEQYVDELMSVLLVADPAPEPDYRPLIQLLSTYGLKLVKRQPGCAAKAVSCVAQIFRLFKLAALMKFNEVTPQINFESFLVSDSLVVKESISLLIIEVLTLVEKRTEKAVVNNIAKFVQIIKRSIFRSLGDVSVMLRRCLLKKFSQFVVYFVGSSYYEITQQTVPFFSDKDAISRAHALLVYDNIMKYLKVRPEINDTVLEFCNGINECKNYEIFDSLLSRVYKLAKENESVKQYLSNVDIKFMPALKSFQITDKEMAKVSEQISNFMKLFFDAKIGTKILQNSFKTLIVLKYPISDYLFHIFNETPYLEDLSTMIPFFIQLSIEGKQFESLIKFCMKSPLVTQNNSLIAALKMNSRSRQTLEITKTFNSFLEENKLIGPSTPFPHDVSSLSELVGLINEPNITSFDIFKAEPYQSISDLITKMNPEEVSANQETCAKLLELVLGILSFIDFPAPINPIPNMDPDELLSTEIKIQIKINENSSIFEFPVDSYLYEIEGYINKFIHSISNQILVNRYKELKSGKQLPFPENFAFTIIAPKEKSDLKCFDSAVVNRMLNTPGYTPYQFQIGSDRYLSQEEFIFCVFNSMENPSNLKKTIPEFDAKKLTGNFQHHQTKSKIVKASLLEPVLALLNVIHKRYPDIEYKNSIFVNHIQTYLSTCVSGSLTRVSYVPWIIIRFPFLFPLEMRFLSSLIIYTNLYNSALSFSSYFSLPLPINKGCRISISFSSDELYSTGYSILNFAREPYFSLELKLNDNIISYNEFLELYSAEFFVRYCSDFHPIFFEKNSIFPLYSLSSDNMYHLGLLVGKAFTSGCCLSMQIHPVIFQFLKNMKLTLEEIDPNLSEIVNSDFLVGQPFHIPYIGKVFPNIEHQLITNENINEYRSLVESYFVGDVIHDSLSKFQKGLTKEIDAGFLEIFSPNELSEMVYSTADITIDDFKHIRHDGVSNESLSTFVKTLCSFSDDNRQKMLKLIVGAHSIPFGKFSFLRPPVSLVRGSSIAFDNIQRVVTLPDSITNKEIEKLLL